MIDLVTIRRALISVSDKAGLTALGEALADTGAEILSTGGTYRALREAGIAVTEVADFTGLPEILDGRVKTLIPSIHGGILGRRDQPAHLAQMAAHDIKPIDLVVCNLYPFEAVVARGARFDECIETIDIGGPALTRSAAKNHQFVTVLTDPSQYAEVIEALRSGGTSLTLRRRLAAAAFARCAAYDAAIAGWFAAQQGEEFPERMVIAGARRQSLRYGENPHQNAAFYVNGARLGIATARQIQGKELSYNNLNDTDAAFECVAEFAAKPAIVIVKHANPCGVATGETLAAAWERALACDPVSAFGGIVAMNRLLDGETAEKIAAIFTEVIIAPDADDAAKAVLARKKNLRLLLTGGVPDAASSGLTFRSVAGGFLAQSRDAGRVARDDLKPVTRRAPSARELEDLLFAFRVAKHVKSNAIVYAKQGATTGIGAGQMSRVDSARIAAWKSGDAVRGSVAASDAFFPFADGLEAIIAAGVTAVIQPGGSIRDAEVIEAADQAGIAMVFTGMRVFRH